MEPLERRGQILIDNVRIDHGGREIAVAQCLLHQANILGLSVQLGRKGVPQYMGMGILG
jgi:hypothetical protein